MLVSTTFEDVEQQMPNRMFWKYIDDERVKRGWSYADIERAAGKRNADGSSIYRAINKQYALTLEQVDVIAKAFDMTRLDVLRKAGYVTLLPSDRYAVDLGAMEIYEIARKLPPAKQKDLRKMMAALVDEEQGGGDESS